MSDGDSPPATAASALLVDAHVHFHPCYARDTFLDAAHGNFAAAYGRIPNKAGFHGILVLVEGHGSNVFREWLGGSIAAPRGDDHAAAPGQWRILATLEDCSLRAEHRSDGRALAVVAGRQVRSRERLEVLALGTDLEYPPGLPFPDCLRLVCSSAPLVVLPWGFGKWHLRRGRRIAEVVRELRSEATGQHLFLGDNGGRPAQLGLRPEILESADPIRPLLSGSDPLPFPDHEDRAGSFGFWIEALHDPDRPWSSLVSRILAGDPVRPYGEPRSLSDFVYDQLRLWTRWR